MPTPTLSARRTLVLAALGLTLLAIPEQGQAQATLPNYRLELRTGAYTPPANLEDFFAGPPPTDLSGGVYYRVVQFWTLPTRERRGRLELAWHVKLLQYLPNNAYLVAFPASFNRFLLNGYGVRSVVKLDAQAKLHPTLQVGGNLPAHAVQGTQALLTVQYANSTSATPAAVRAALEAAGATELEFDEANYLVKLRMPIARIGALAEVPMVFFIEPVGPPPQKEDRPGRSNHRTNYINSDYPLGRHYSGAGVVVALGDDGELGPHIDYQGRLEQTNVLGTNSGDHGDHCAGIIMAAGNLDPRQRGQAPAADLRVYDPYENINMSAADYGAFGVRITSTSYADGCNAGYTTFAQTCDRQTRQNPALLHVFSAGNSGTSNCNFVTGWGNITGGNKSGKNVIAVGALDFHDQLASFSSRGPATDGRIKPEVCAVGVNVNSTLPNNTYGLNSGTSMACPGVSGTSALLYDLYRRRHQGGDPLSGLIKSALMATADDLGQPGPDFQFGYGRINARRAAQLLEENRYITDSVDQAQTRSFPLTVPAGTRELRVMTYWTDYEGTVLSTRALVNDLDTRLVAPDSSTYQPWVLNPSRNATTLAAPAVRSRDSLNNVEQITLPAPPAGTYTLRVSGRAVPQGPQSFFVLYEFITDSITVTYPLGGEAFSAGDAETLRWDTPGNVGTFDLSVSADSGATWQNIGTAPGDRRYFDWTPNAARLGQRLLFRVSRNGHVGQSEAAFSVMGVPSNIRPTRVCADSITLEWGAVAGAAHYDIYRLGARFMDSVGTSTTARVMLPAVGVGEEWYSVRAVSAAGAVGRRANAIRRAPGLANCTLALDAELLSLVSPVTGRMTTCAPSQGITVAVQVRNGGSATLAGLRVFYRINNGAVVSDTVASPLPTGTTRTVTFASQAPLAVPGTYRVVTWVRLPGDTNRFNDSASATVTLVAGTIATVPHAVSMDTWATCSVTTNCGSTVCSLADGWQNVPNGGGDDIDWRTNNGATASVNTGPDFDHTTGTTTGRYLYLEASTCLSKTALLHSPCFDLRGMTAPEFSGWYHAFGAAMGSLHVDVLPDSGAAVLDVIPAISGDQGNQWVRFAVPLTAYVGHTVTVRLRGITGTDFTSDLALDDLGLREALVQGVGADAANLNNRLALVPNPTTGTAHLRRPDTAEGDLTLTLVDVRGSVVWRGTLTGAETTLDLLAVPAGTYALRVQSARTSVVRRLVKL